MDKTYKTLAVTLQERAKDILKDYQNDKEYSFVCTQKELENMAINDAKEEIMDNIMKWFRGIND